MGDREIAALEHERSRVYMEHHDDLKKQTIGNLKDPKGPATGPRYEIFPASLTGVINLINQLRALRPREEERRQLREARKARKVNQKQLLNKLAQLREDKKALEKKKPRFAWRKKEQSLQWNADMEAINAQITAMEAVRRELQAKAAKPLRRMLAVINR